MLTNVGIITLFFFLFYRFMNWNNLQNRATKTLGFGDVSEKQARALIRLSSEAASGYYIAQDTGEKGVF